ncbi:hypothetical protein KIS1582_0859 [Cytobacillus firmus]|uniref:Uncharacterized protein n=1 Tax=Cytobacillus firmus TaxID=1399 RepID=A0A800NEG0_CYTFI|nr:hypothetical protein KIS1582_0859 [Cytobacillus firmus]
MNPADDLILICCPNHLVIGALIIYPGWILIFCLVGRHSDRKRGKPVG